MGPGVYKTQSDHTKKKLPYPTVTKGHEESKPVLPNLNTYQSFVEVRDPIFLFCPTLPSPKVE
jgi:hypothetical protein